MVDPDGEIRRFNADTSCRGRSGLEVKTRWEAAGLVIETKTPRGQVKENVVDRRRAAPVMGARRH